MHRWIRILVMACVCGGAAPALAQDADEGLPGTTTQATVTGHEDGEKLQVTIGEQQETVRLIGVDAPEPENDDGEEECYARESTERLAELLPKGRTVYLERDTSDRDGKDRLLRYVWFLGDNSRPREREGKAYFANEIMAYEGFVVVKEEDKDTRYEDRLKSAGDGAREKNAGFWGACGGPHEVGEPRPLPTPVPTSVPPAAPAPFTVVQKTHEDAARPRQVWRIMAAAGLPADVVGATLAEAARQALESDADAMVAVVFGYREGDDTTETYTLGVAEVSRDGNGHSGDGTYANGALAGYYDGGYIAVAVVTELSDDAVAVPVEEEVYRFLRERADAETDDLAPAYESSTTEFTPDEQAYLSAIGEEVRTLRESLRRYAELASVPSMGQVDWELAVAEELALWQLTYEGAEQRVPPPAFEEINDLYVESLSLLNRAADDINVGLDNFDLASVDQGEIKIRQARALLSDVDRLLDEITAERAQ